MSQQAKREVQKFVDKMVTGKEAWVDVQRMKQAAGHPHGMSSSSLLLVCSFSLSMYCILLYSASLLLLISSKFTVVV